MSAVGNIKKGLKSIFGSDRKKSSGRGKDVLCNELSFESSEAYKLLRANLSFSLPDDGNCQVIGITSAIRGEGKSTVAINLSYTIAQTGKKVLLIDSDMRLPSVAKKMGIPGKPGLSNTIVGLCNVREAILKSDLVSSWHILPAGSIPPNPSELLGTKHFENLITELKKEYDTIVFDLPPVTIVSDAMVVSPVIDGYIVVVRQDYTDKGAVVDCMDQMKVIESKILGFVMSASTKSEKGYYRYKHHYGYGYGYYGHRHKHGYGYSYGYSKNYSERYGYESKSSKNKEFIEATTKTTHPEDEK